MKRNLLLVFLLKTLSLYFCYAAQACFKKSSCSCETDDQKLIDLSSLAGKDNFAFGYTAASPEPDEFLYAWNPCNAITESSGECINAASCRKDATTSITIGTQDTAKFDTTSGENVVLQYTALGPDEIPFDVWVELICDPDQKDPIFKVDGDISYLIYQYKLTSKCCCPDGCKGGSGGKSGLSFGSILCILFSVLLVVYIASGIGYAKYKGRTGKEMIPNYSFWSDLPYAIKDGFKFSISLVRGKSYTPSTSAKAKPSAYGSM